MQQVGENSKLTAAALLRSRSEYIRSYVRNATCLTTTAAHPVCLPKSPQQRSALRIFVLQSLRVFIRLPAVRLVRRRAAPKKRTRPGRLSYPQQNIHHPAMCTNCAAMPSTTRMHQIFISISSHVLIYCYIALHRGSFCHEAYFFARVHTYIKVLKIIVLLYLRSNTSLPSKRRGESCRSAAGSAA